ncbi:hypothetical protein RSSM_01949 [Rhodopirellula sallentina SM41]|uniref:Uncharacterized protein n=1 Tax=Rhodopirellula sallentina SM41 TaxID=1263870 RepID=M5UFI7_9BACT|nr:hypothetical protein RSSM_01949 [Rhodopirellula sallentina SM41]
MFADSKALIDNQPIVGGRIYSPTVILQAAPQDRNIALPTRNSRHVNNEKCHANRRPNRSKI